ncbi:hypothetical protein [Actinomadura flavalba]|uniref:hypothetical protein n=1 Tax=Actinomadura flavalba TaxID=1120938 RepID=UPI0003A413B0|nr:hypothetical protein [Actinomadura flavalba]
MRRLLPLVAALVLLPVVPASAAAARVTLDRTTVRPGETVTVRLTGWAAGNVVVEVCGNEARRGTADCAVATSATTFVQAKKTASVLLTVAKPPIACPCVVAARPVTGGDPVTAPLKIAGMDRLSSPETGALADSRKLTVTRVSVAGGGLAPWVGGSAARTLRFTVRNDGRATLTDPPLSLAVGRGADPTTIVPAQPLGTLAAGEERAYEIPFTIAAPTFGRYSVRGEITTLDEPIAFTAHTSSYPWALPLAGALLVLLSLVRALRRPARPPVIPADAPTPDRVISMNQVVAANVTRYRRERNLSPEALATALTRLTGHPWNPGPLADAGVDSPLVFTANDLLALSRTLDVPLPSLLLPPTDQRYRIAAADPHELAEQISVDGVELLRTVAPQDDPAYQSRLATINKSFLG